MLNLSNTFIGLLQSADIYAYLLLDINFGTRQRYTTAGHDIVYNGNTYIWKNQITGISFPTQNTEVARSEMVIELTDTGIVQYNNRLTGGNPLRTALEARSTGTAVILTLLLKSGTDFTTNTLTLFNGRIASYSYDFKDTSFMVKISCLGSFYKLNQVTTRNTTSFIQKSYDSTDTCFDYVHQKNDGIPFVWGN